MGLKGFASCYGRVRILRDSNRTCHMVTNAQLIRIWNLELVEPVMVRPNELTDWRRNMHAKEKRQLSACSNRK